MKPKTRFKLPAHYEIITIIHDFVDIRRILRDTYERTCAEALNDGVQLLKLSDEKIKKGDNRVLLNDMEIVIVIRDILTGEMYRLCYKLKKWWMTDFASVPKFPINLRSLVDNDDARIIIAALVHDTNWESRWLNFFDTNRLFRDTILYYCDPDSLKDDWFATKAYSAVSLNYYGWWKKTGTQLREGRRMADLDVQSMTERLGSGHGNKEPSLEFRRRFSQ
jgi:hypothetical protein